MKRTASLHSLATIIGFAALLLAPRAHTQFLAAEENSFDPGEWLLMKLFEATSKPVAKQIVELEQLPAGGASAAMSPEDYGADLWLEIGRPTGGSLPVKVHNTASGKKYPLWSRERLSGTDAWRIEQTFTGAAGQDFTDLTVPLMGRSSLFFIVPLSFEGIASDEAASTVSDAQGAIGPYNLVQIVNGKIVVFDRSTGERIPGEVMSLDLFLGGTGVVDPRLLYDHASQAWVACGVQGNPNVVRLAVRNGESPVPLSGWAKRTIPVPFARVRTEGTQSPPDFTTLGSDANGVYVTTVQRSIVNDQVMVDAQTILALPKPGVYMDTSGTTTWRRDIDTDLAGLQVRTIQPAVNFDDPVAGGYAWFVAKGPPDHGTPYQGGAIFYRRLQWSGTNAALDTVWQQMSADYRDYFDCDDPGVNAPQITTVPSGNLNYVGSRLTMAVIRDGTLWTCHHVGLNQTTGTYDPAGPPVNRSAAQWFKLQIVSGGASLAYSTHGRVYDNAATNPLWYHFPSLMVNSSGDMAMGFSGSANDCFPSVFYSYRLADGAMPEFPGLIHRAEAQAFHPQFADYSSTSLDPNDEITFWTVQTFAKNPSTTPDEWGTWIAKIRAGP